jgi:hypothetical protein
LIFLYKLEEIFIGVRQLIRKEIEMVQLLSGVLMEYPDSQRLGTALTDHPADLGGLVRERNCVAAA